MYTSLAGRAYHMSNCTCASARYDMPIGDSIQGRHRRYVVSYRKRNRQEMRIVRLCFKFVVMALAPNPKFRSFMFPLGWRMRTSWHLESHVAPHSSFLDPTLDLDIFFWFFLGASGFLLGVYKRFLWEVCVPLTMVGNPTTGTCRPTHILKMKYVSRS